MTEFKVTYLNRRSETVEAHRYVEANEWLVFQDGTGVTTLQVRAALVARIERVADPKEAPKA